MPAPRSTHCFARRMVCLILGSTTLLGLAAAPEPTRAQVSDVVLPIHLAVAITGDAPVADEAWAAAQIEEANRVFRPASIKFEITERSLLDQTSTRLETRGDRDALGTRMKRGAINWFVTSSLRDVDTPALYRRGVHWRPRGFPGRHFVIVSAVASSSVLAHELGHFFGNPHSATPNNIMSYERDPSVEPFFSRPQLVRIRRMAQKMLASGELIALSPARVR